MEKNNWINVSNPLIKQGNSYCVRLPAVVVRELKAKEGNLIAMKVQKLKLEFTPEASDHYYKTARKCKALNRFGKEKIILLAMLSFNEGKAILEANKGKLAETKDEQRKAQAALNKYRANIAKEFGRELLQEFLLFRKHVDPKMN